MPVIAKATSERLAYVVPFQTTVGHYHDALRPIVPFTREHCAWAELDLLPIERNEFGHDSRTVVFSADLIQKLLRATIKVT